MSDHAIRLWVGDYISTTAVSALSTEKGIVVIDSTEIPDLDKKFRKVIAREFGRKDFVYLINTHEHRDHTTGNGVYKDCEIIAHERCAAAQEDEAGGREDGGATTASDIFVFVPQEGLLFTGDMMADEWFTDTPGCLQAFGMRRGIERDLPLTLANWKSLIARKDEIDHYVPGHWNGGLTYKGFVDRYNYLETLYEGIREAVEADEKLAGLFVKFDLAERFPHLDGTPGFTNRSVHNGTLMALWSDLSGAESASAALATGIEEEGLQAAITEIGSKRARNSGKYYFLEGEFNGLGYRFVAQGDYPTAIAVFKLNVELNPDSWNVFDSLAEAYMRDGQDDLAVRNYNRSIELNPDNENGKQMLEQIRTGTTGG